MLSISKLLQKTGHQIFIHISTVLGVSLGWSLFLVPAIYVLPIFWAIVFLVITLFPATTAVYAVLNKVMNGERSAFRNFFICFVSYFRRSFLIGLVLWLAIIIPVSAWWYYFNVSDGYQVFLFSAFQTYLCFTFLSAQVYTIPLLVLGNLSVFQAMNQSIKYFMRHTWYSIGLFVQILCVTILLGISVVGFFLLYMGMLAVFVINATKNIQLAATEKNPSSSKVEQTA